MSQINWNTGNLITMTPGDTATCQGLNSGQLYALVFYNSALNDANVTVTVVWSNTQPPVTVTVPGTTANQGLASVLFVNGTDTTTVAASVTQGQSGVQVQAFIASVKFPTNTAGINNLQLPADGHPHAFTKFTRYYCVPASHWYQGQIQSNINTFISIQFTEQAAIVYVVNGGTNPPQVQGVGTALSQNQYKVVSTSYNITTFNILGNGQQYVFVNADSVQDSQSATITLQSLSGLYSLV